MSRRDIIIVAVLLNAGLLAILFMMAINNSDDVDVDSGSVNQIVINEQAGRTNEEPEVIQITSSTLNHPHSTATDEWDTVIKDYAATVPPQTIVLEEETADELEKESAALPSLAPQPAAQPQIVEASRESSADGFVEVKVKRGDALEKIARANGTTVDAIKKANNMKNDKLNIGQTLKIPTKTSKAAQSIAKGSMPPQPVKVVPASTAAEYYTIKSGDNPWKIAKQFRVKFDDLLKLNNLDEESARNMKIGDRIRVR